MTLDDVPVFAMLKSRMNYLADRQRLIAENVANADTPGFAPRDLSPFKVTQPSLSSSHGGPTLAPVSLSVTSGMHLAGAPSTTDSGAKPVAAPDSEGTLDGNSVVLEDEMLKMGEARTDYNAAVSFYEKSLGLLQLATRRPGQ
jgi:flagellar basal-body rod protein FlgB